LNHDIKVKIKDKIHLNDSVFHGKSPNDSLHLGPASSNPEMSGA